MGTETLGLGVTNQALTNVGSTERERVNSGRDPCLTGLFDSEYFLHSVKKRLIRASGRVSRNEKMNSGEIDEIPFPSVSVSFVVLTDQKRKVSLITPSGEVEKTAIMRARAVVGIHSFQSFVTHHAVISLHSTLHYLPILCANLLFCSFPKRLPQIPAISSSSPSSSLVSFRLLFTHWLFSRCLVFHYQL